MQFFEKHSDESVFVCFFVNASWLLTQSCEKESNELKRSSKSPTECWKRKDSWCCNGPVNIQTSTWLRCCYRTLGELCINQYLQMSTSWSNDGAEGGSMSYWMTRFLVFTAESCEMFFLTWQCMFRESVITRGTADKWWIKKRTNSTKFSAFCNKFKYLEFYFNFTASIENTSLHMDKVWY